jgi:alkyl sulfatase BDS1-like metallo-beta-lactamase superfamily hydrolase
MKFRISKESTKIRTAVALAVLVLPFGLNAADLPDFDAKAFSSEKYSAGNNPYKVERYAPQYFVDHAKQFEAWESKHPSAPVWSIIADGSVSTQHIIDAPDGLILLDAGLTREQMEPVAARIKELSDKPLKAIIYTHAHVDHTGGIDAFVTEQQVENGEVEIIASEKFMEAYVSENASTGPLMGQRAILMYGALMQQADKDQFVTGCCGNLSAGGESGFITPTRTVGDDETLTVAGLEMHFVHTGGENAAHIIAYVPAYKTVFIGDELQGPAAPQLHSPRGTKFRDTDAWISAIDKIRVMDPEHMMPGHGKATYGRDSVSNILVKYRDAMQFQHDQSIRLINQGKSPDDLANEVVVPDYLTIDPFTVQTYGKTTTIVRSYFTGYVSWFDGNPANLDPLPKVEEDRRLVEAMGGRDKVIALAEKALKGGDIKWSVALSDKLVRIDNGDQQARYLKAAGFRHLGYATYNSTNRGFYLGGADELDGVLDMDVLRQAGKQFTAAPGVIEGLPTADLMETLRYKVLPDEVKGSETSYYFMFKDTGEEFTLILRNGILEVNKGKLEHDVALTTDRKAFDRLFNDENAPSITELGKIKGDKAAVKRFDKALDFTFHPIRISVQ